MSFGTNENGLKMTSPDGKTIRASCHGRKWVLCVCDTGVSALVSEFYVLWHQQFGHPDKRVLQEMVDKQSCYWFP